MLVCTSCGIATTTLVVKGKPEIFFKTFNCNFVEYLRFPTATSTTIKLVNSLELPAITICPKIGDSFHFNEIYAGRVFLGNLQRTDPNSI